MRRVLVTGSSGQLGKVTVQHLRTNGFTVTGVDLLPSSTTDEVADITHEETAHRLTQNIDAVIHTAAIHGKHFELGYPRHDFISVNILGTLILLEACVKNGVQRFLYTSTTSIYGQSLVNDDQAVWVDEDLPIRPRDIYDITKQAAEELCRDFFYKEGLQISVYRVGRFLPEPQNLRLNHRLYRGLDERDGAEALQLALGSTFDKFEIFNISSGSPFGKEDLSALKRSAREVILKHYPQAEAVYAANGWAFPESIDRVYVSEKARRMLNYQPRYTFEYLLNNVNSSDK